MLVTDDPERFGRELELPDSWRHAPVGGLDPIDEEIFQALAPGAEPWVQEAEGLWRPDMSSRASSGPLSVADPLGRLDPLFWHRIFLVGEARGSQFDTLREFLAKLSADGPALPGPVAALALTGTGFHGQRGRHWAAAAGNLHLCAVIAPQVPVSEYALALTTLPAVVAIDTIRAVSGDRLAPRIKWVNDVVLEGKKVAGVLTATQSSGDRLETAVFGIGMNVAGAPEVPPTPFVPEVGCLQRLVGGEDVSFPAVVRAALAALAQRIRTLRAEGPERLVSDYLEAARWMIGQDVRIYPEGLIDTGPAHGWPAPDAFGRLLEVRRDLGLLLAERIEPVQRGRLALEESCLAFGLPPIR